MAATIKIVLKELSFALAAYFYTSFDLARLGVISSANGILDFRAPLNLVHEDRMKQAGTEVDSLAKEILGMDGVTRILISRYQLTVYATPTLSEEKWASLHHQILENLLLIYKLDKKLVETTYSN